MKIRYRRITVEIEGIRPDKCECCNKKAKKIDYHHWKYAYKTSEVRKNPQLAFKNGSFLCYYCHGFGDALRKMNACPDIIWQRLLVLNRVK